MWETLPISELVYLQAADFWNMGLEPVAVSAISGSGTGDLMEQIVGALPASKAKEVVAEGPEPLAVAIIGRPNVGKSSLLYAFVGRERSIVSSMSGTTRDAIDTDLVRFCCMLGLYISFNRARAACHLSLRCATALQCSWVRSGLVATCVWCCSTSWPSLVCTRSFQDLFEVQLKHKHPKQRCSDIGLVCVYGAVRLNMF